MTAARVAANPSRRAAGSGGRDGWTRVGLPGPLDVAASVAGFRRWGDDMLDRWDGITLVRVIDVGQTPVAVAARVSGSVLRPRLEVTAERPELLAGAATALVATFVAAPGALAALAAADPLIARLETAYPGVRPVLQPDLYTAIVRSISAQQVNLPWAATTRRRLAEAYGTAHEVAGHDVRRLDAVRLAGVSVADIRALQFTTRKAEYIVGTAEEIASGRLGLDELRSLPDDEVVTRLSALRGVGTWTAEWLLCRTLGRPRVVAGDLGVRKAVGAAYLNDSLPSEARVRDATAHWGEAATVAQQLLLHDLIERTDGPVPWAQAAQP
ncbi:MAG: DNA-3-methyladenine glycosylase 2 family protein [Chloroflexi bacterium]|nr:MAG: DNA-3-methyladenine glycosylase 2 family protein [Chloroflexota bacterium]